MPLMSQFSESDLENLEKLCRIRLTEEERASLTENLDKILRAVARLSEIDTEGVSPCLHVIAGVSAPLREDDPEEAVIKREDFLQSSPEFVGGFVKVPQVIQESP